MTESIETPPEGESVENDFEGVAHSGATEPPTANPTVVPPRADTSQPPPRVGASQPPTVESRASSAPEESERTTSAPPPSEIEVVRAERDKLKDQLLRTAADFDNYRKRARKDMEESDRKGREETVRDFLPIFDNLERAVTASHTVQELSSIREGIQMVLKLFEDQASRVGLLRVRAAGEKFDPSLHDAIQQVATDEHAPGTIVTEIVPGYHMNGKLLRPAMVVVAKKPEASA